MTKAWVLVGMMGAGKSSVGRILSERSDREFVDTDLLLQNRLGRSIPQIFQIYGEKAFRDHETSILRGLQPAASVISTGGGIVLKEENWVELRRLGVVIYLKASPEILISRLETSKKKRPLLESDDWTDRVRSLLEERRPLYERADVTVEVGEGDVMSAVDLILDKLSSIDHK